MRKDLNGISEKYKYTGKEKDITGLYYFGARYYDPTIGRFITKDPIKGNSMNPQTLNPYVYCLNNPMKYIDPDGEWYIGPHDLLPDGDVEVDPTTWDTFYDPELRQKYYDEWAKKNSDSSGRKHKSKKSWWDRLKDSFYFTGDYEVSEIQWCFGYGCIGFDVLTNKKTGETRYYVSGGLGPSKGIQLSGGKANIESFGEYEGPFSQFSAGYIYMEEKRLLQEMKKEIEKCWI